jgi:ADP-ribosylglycohydrolase
MEDALLAIETLSRLERHAFACLAYGVVGDAMGSPTELLDPGEIERRFGWVETFEGTGTDDVIMRDLLAAALVVTGGYANADDWAYQWHTQSEKIFGGKANRFFPSILHAAEKLRRAYLPRLIAEGTMPTTTSAMAIAPVGIVNAGNPRAAAAQATEIASLVHVTHVAFCQDGAAAVASAIAAAFLPGATVDSVLEAAVDSIKPWSGAEMRALITEVVDLAKSSQDYKTFRKAFQESYCKPVICDSRETVPAALAMVWLAGGDPWKAVVLSANFGRDADTIGCMAGGICGALSGIGEGNAERLDPLPGEALLEQRRLAIDLVAIRHSKASAEKAAWSTSI